MQTSVNLWLYFLLVFGVIVLPGMDMAFVMGSSMVSGRRAGLAAVAGMVVGGICHMIIGASGVFTVLTLFPAALTLMLFAGAAYVAWIGWSLIKINVVEAPQAALTARSPRSSFLGAIATCLLNPKAYLFMLAVFPQFIRADQGSIWGQAAVLSLITAGTQIAVYGSLALLAAGVQVSLAAKPRAATWLARVVGAVLLTTAGITLASSFAASCTFVCKKVPYNPEVVDGTVHARYLRSTAT